MNNANRTARPAPQPNEKTTRHTPTANAAPTEAKTTKTEEACWRLAFAMADRGAAFPGLNVLNGGHGFSVTSAQFDRFVRIHGLRVSLGPDGGRMARLDGSAS